MNKREEIQEAIIDSVRNNDFNGLINVAPRVGKTKPVIEAIGEKTNWNISVSTPTEVVKQVWNTEIKKWKSKNKLQILCSRSLGKIPELLDLLIVDEPQELSINQILEIKQKKPRRILFMSGTVYERSIGILQSHFNMKEIYKYTIDQAIADRIISDYHVFVVDCALDPYTRNVVAGPPDRTFLTTELDNYIYLTERFEELKEKTRFDFANNKLKQYFVRERANAIYTSPSKILLAQQLMLVESDKVMGFTTRQKVADQISPWSFHGSSDKANLDKFKKGEILKLSVVKMVNLGETIPGLKRAVAHQLEMNSEMSVQKILRTCNIEDPQRRARIWLLRYKDTVDEKWTDEALSEIPKSKITVMDQKKFST